MKNSKIVRHISGIIYLTAFISLPSNSLFAQKAYASLDSNQMLIGDRMTLRLSVELYEKDRVLSIAPDVPLDTTTFEIIAAGKWDNGSRLSKLVRNIVFTTFDTGLFQIPKVIFTIKHYNGDVSTVESPPLLLTVLNPKGVETMATVADIKGIEREAATFDDFMPYILGGVLLAAVAFLGFALWKKFRQRTVLPTIQKIAAPPHLVAERLLAELQAKQLWQQGKIKEFYSELTYILRGYLENQFAFPALESTTSDLIPLVQKSSLTEFRGNDALIFKIKNLLETADLVKFAKVEPAENTHQNLWSVAAEIVEQTKPKPMQVIENQ